MKNKYTATNPIDVKVSDINDEELEAIIKLRKKISSDEERIAYIQGLYYISTVDADYSDVEKSIVEGTAGALGINEEGLADLTAALTSSKNPIGIFSEVGSKKFKEDLFEEMGLLTYLKGYQLSVEDTELKKVAKQMGISDDKAEKKLLDMYMQVQGFATSKSQTTKLALGAGGVLAGAAICAVTAGVAAPVIGAAIGNLMGYSGVAAVNAGLAFLGGGSLAAGGAGIAGGTAVITATGAAVGGGVAAMAASVTENITNAYDRKKLKAVIKKQQKNEMTKQEITDNLITAIETQKVRLKELEEKQASKRDLASVKLQIANLEAEKAELELEG